MVDTLKTKLKSLRIDEYWGENTSNLVSHIRLLYQRLKILDQQDDDRRILVQTILDDIGKTFIKLFQISSDVKFNSIFQLKESNIFKGALVDGDKMYGSAIEILNYRHLIYTNISSTKEG